MRRVSVVGVSGSGKTHLARRLAVILGVPHVELDAIHHRPGWEPIDQDTFLATVTDVAATDGWVVDGNYSLVVSDGPVWARADTVVWLDLRRSTVMFQVIVRSLRRVLLREELWNGNKEPWRQLVAWDPYRSIIRYAWTHHPVYRQRYSEAMCSPSLTHLAFVRLRSHNEAERWLAEITSGGPG